MRAATKRVIRHEPPPRHERAPGPSLMAKSVKPKRRGVDSKGRSKGEEQYWKVPYIMLRSPAWRSLGGPAVKVYMELRTRFNGRNNGDLSLSLDEAKRLLAIGKSTAQRAFKELEAKGFIRETRRGQWYGRLASLYALTDRPLYGNPATNDWKHWRPPGKTKSRSCSETVVACDGPVSGPRNF